VRCCIEEATTAPFDTVMLNNLDRSDLGMDAATCASR